MKILLILPETKGSFDVYKQSPSPKCFVFLLRRRRQQECVFSSARTDHGCRLHSGRHRRANRGREGGRPDRFQPRCGSCRDQHFAYSARRGYEIADRFRSRNRKVVLGGFHVFFSAEEALQHADAVVIGEAEPVWKFCWKISGQAP